MTSERSPSIAPWPVCSNELAAWRERYDRLVRTTVRSDAERLAKLEALELMTMARVSLNERISRLETRTTGDIVVVELEEEEDLEDALRRRGLAYDEKNTHIIIVRYCEELPR